MVQIYCGGGIVRNCVRKRERMVSRKKGVKKSAPKKSAPKKSAKKSAPKKSRKAPEGESLDKTLGKIVTGLMILSGIVVGAAFLADHYLGRGKAPAPKRQVPHIVRKSIGMEKVPGRKVADGKVAVPKFEIYPEEEKLPEPPVSTSPPPAEKRPEVALIIDDIGYDRGMAEKLLALDLGLTFSVLPHSPHQREIAGRVHEKGLEVMLHLPMEPLEYPRVKPGPGALLTGMEADKLLAELERNLVAVPFIRGVNNHMGSRMTEVSTQMYQIFTTLKKQKLFFIDSRTSPRSLCKPSARLLRIPFGERDIFLDHVQTVEAVTVQLKKLLAVAGRRGTAIGIGHPYRVTYEVLRDHAPELKTRIRLVPASSLVRILE